MSSGARGLNLTEATHVLFVEPQLNIAEEAQAVARVHRIGQTAETHIYRFIVRHSVEETMYDWRRNDRAYKHTSPEETAPSTSRLAVEDNEPSVVDAPIAAPDGSSTHCIRNSSFTCRHPSTTCARLAHTTTIRPRVQQLINLFANRHPVIHLYSSP